jgi:hypothetical protein
VSDGSGNAVVTYVAGGNDPAFDVSDSVRASVGSISSSATITRTGSGATTGNSIDVTANPTSVNAGQVSIITATLTGSNVIGVDVTFTLPVNNSGATLSASTATTDGSGKAVVTYTAGLTNPTQNVSDTVRAAAGSISSSAAITRTGSASTPGYSVTVSAVPATLTAGTSNSIITANVKNNGAAVIGQLVTFNITAGVGTGLLIGTANTDASGNAVITFTGQGGTTGQTSVVTASINVPPAYTGSVIITYP